MGKMFEQAPIPIFMPEVFETVKTAIASTFAPSSADKFLTQVERRKLRVRDFEHVLERGLLGEPAKSAYGQLGDTDRGQIREFYLSSLERVTPELRRKHLKVYAYYSE